MKRQSYIEKALGSTWWIAAGQLATMNTNVKHCPGLHKEIILITGLQLILQPANPCADMMEWVLPYATIIIYLCYYTPVAYCTKEGNQSLAKLPLEFSGIWPKIGLTSLGR